jgi:MotA/TolQ/ExbB proton channel family protein
VFREEFELGGPVMYGVFVVWALLMALILERVLFWLRFLIREWREPELPPHSRERFIESSGENLERIDALSQLATSLGLFGTVLGISQAFFARGAELTLAAPEVLASGMATALFTTVAGLAVFLVGQGALVLFRWWTDAWLRRLPHPWAEGDGVEERHEVKSGPEDTGVAACAV